MQVLNKTVAGEGFSVSGDLSLYNELILIISNLKNIQAECLIAQPALEKHGLDIVDLVDIIPEVERRYGLVIPDEVPVYTVDDLINFISVYCHKQAG